VARTSGPRSAVGRRTASRNALKHGLSVSIRHRPDISGTIEDLAVEIAGKNAAPRLLNAARDVAEADLERRRLAKFRLALMEVEAAKIHAATNAVGDKNAGLGGRYRKLHGPTCWHPQFLAGSMTMSGGLGLAIGARFRFLLLPPKNEALGAARSIASLNTAASVPGYKCDPKEKPQHGYAGA